MLGLFEPKCPLGTAEKMWTESRMRWLAGTLGFDRLAGCEVILPEERYFPEPYSGSPDDARTIFNRVCAYMKLDPDRFDLRILPDESMPSAVGLYHQAERPAILLAESRLADPERLVATIAHELAHDVLLGGGVIDRDEEDHEPITDLVPVFLGLGVFAANATVRDQSYTQNNMQYFKIDRQGYLSSSILGYALSLFAYARAESSPRWARHLRPDAAGPLQAGLRYLIKTGDTLFHRDTVHQPDAPPTEAQVLERLATGSATVRVRTLRDAARLDPPPAAALDAIIRCLSDRDPDVQVEAARALPAFGEAARAALPELRRCLSSRSEALRAEAAAAFPAVGASADEVVTELSAMLKDHSQAIVDGAAAGLRRLGQSAARAMPVLVEAIRFRETRCQSSEALADAIVAIDPHPELLNRLLGPIDPDIRRLIDQSLRAAGIRRRFDDPGRRDRENPGAREPSRPLATLW